MGARGFNFGCLRQFLSNFVIQRNLLNCNKYNAKCFFASRGLPFLASKFNPQIIFFKTPSWTPFSDIFIWILNENWRFVGPLQGPVGAKMFPHWPCKNVILKRYVCQHCVALKTGKPPPFYMFLRQFLDGNYIFSNLLANVPRRPKVCKRTPSQIWGASKSLPPIPRMHA